VDPQITLREIATTAVDFVGLCHSACHDLNPRVQCQAIALGSGEFKAHPMVAWNAVILQNHRTSVKVADYNVHIAVIKKIPDR
jgi:hypothetical protein